MYDIYIYINNMYFLGGLGVKGIIKFPDLI